MPKEKGIEKGGKKRSKPLSSSDESPPKENVGAERMEVPGQSDDDSLTSDKSGSMKFEDVGSQYSEATTCIVRSLSDDQISEVGVRIYNRWTSLRQALRCKSDSGMKRSRSSDPPQHAAAEAGPSEMPNMTKLINAEIEALEQYRKEVEKEREEEMKEQDPEERAFEAWERYRFKKEAFSHHRAIQSFVITVRESVEMMDRLTAAMSTMKLRIQGAPAAEAHPELDSFFVDLQKTRERLSSQSSSESLLTDKSSSSRDSMITHPPQSPGSTSPDDSKSSTF